MSQRKASPPPNNLNMLYRIAVLIMSTISAITTAFGAQDLFGPPMAVALAVGISVLLVAIAFNLPKAFREGRALTLIIGYSFIALISVLFNFNYIYGKFAAEDLLYTELVSKREAIDALEVEAITTMDKQLEVENLRSTINEQALIMEREENHPLRGESGRGPRYENAAMARRLAEEQLNSRLQTKAYFYKRIETDVDSLKSGIEAAVNSQRDLTSYRAGIEQTVKRFNELRNFVMKELPGITPPSMGFVNKDIGKLNHTIWSFTQFSNLSGKQRSSLLVALVISLAIDFVVLFVLAIVARGGGVAANPQEMTLERHESSPRRRRGYHGDRTDDEIF